uniref:Uncharacterized protein n=1 Tax=Anguilla anguilla TaxID=7936 RepID=A0A0E9SFE4_ANGAN
MALTSTTYIQCAFQCLFDRFFFKNTGWSTCSGDRTPR